MTGSITSGVTCTKEIADSMKAQVHFNTYGGNPVSMAAGKAVIDCIEKNDYMHNAQVMRGILIDGFKKLEKKHQIVGEVRGKGLMLGLEIVTDKESREVAPQHVQKMMELCRDRGLLIGRGGMAANTIRIKPPLCIDKNDCEFILKTLDECFGIVRRT